MKRITIELKYIPNDEYTLSDYKNGYVYAYKFYENIIWAEDDNFNDMLIDFIPIGEFEYEGIDNIFDDNEEFDLNKEHFLNNNL